MKKLVIAGGGTGGHIYPALAVAQEFLSRDRENRVLMVGVRGGKEEELLAQTNLEQKWISAKGFMGKGLITKISSLGTVPVGIVQAINILRVFKPDAVLGTGGYVSVPTLIAAWLTGFRTAIHEQNAIAGMGNLWLGKIVDRVFLSFESASKDFPRAKRKNAICITGNPIRKEVIKELLESEKCEPHKFCVLVVGGSLGAKKLNELMVSALPFLEPYRNNIKFVHQTGEYGQYDIAMEYSRRKFQAKVYGFITEIGKMLKGADLVISRAGAGAIFEIALSGKPSILVPFPYAIGDHQAKNAQVLVDAGAARMFREKDLTGEKLARQIIEFYKDREMAERMGRNARKLARPYATKEIVDELYKLMEARKHS